MIAQSENLGDTGSSTPHSNTGSNRLKPCDTGLRVGVDYLTFTGHTDIEVLTNAVHSAFGTNFDFAGAKPGVRGRYYSTILKSPQGIELAYVGDTSSERLHSYRLSIPGSPLCHVDISCVNKFCRFIASIRGVCTRFDWRIDDFDRALRMESILQALQDGDYSGAQSWSNYRSRRGRGSQLGWTVYIGSPMSEKRVRIYDKNVESKGEVDSIRFEVQWRGQYAAKAFQTFLLFGMGTDRDNSLSNLAIGSVSFVGRTNEVLSRCEPLPWWEDFVSRVGVQVKMSVRRLQPLISDTIHWVEHQVVGALAVISVVKGFDDTINWLERIIRDKMANLSSMQSALVQTIRDRLQVERGDFSDWMIISEWNKV